MVGHEPEEESSALEKSGIVFISVCFLFAHGIVFTSAHLRILALSSAFNFILGASAVNGESGKGSSGGVTLILPIKWKGVFP